MAGADHRSMEELAIDLRLADDEIKKAQQLLVKAEVQHDALIKAVTKPAGLAVHEVNFTLASVQNYTTRAQAHIALATHLRGY